MSATAISSLVQGAIQVRDGLTLIAFLTLAMLIAFRTKQVPELVFGLVRDKLTRAEFAKILNRVLLLGFIWFMALLVVTVASQVISRMPPPGVLKLSDLKSELAKAKASEDDQRHAEIAYAQATQMLGLHEIDGAIAALKDSIQSVPTLTAQETLLRLYRQKGDIPAASATLEAAIKLATVRGDTTALARLNKEVTADPPPAAGGDHDLIGASAPLPKGGDRYETAVPLASGFYACREAAGCGDRWFRLPMRAGQRLDVKWRNATEDGATCVYFYGTNGEALNAEENGPSGRTVCTGYADAGLYEVIYTAPKSGAYYLRIKMVLGDVLRFWVS
jgi:hypothetical protein